MDKKLSHVPFLIIFMVLSIVISGSTGQIALALSQDSVQLLNSSSTKELKIPQPNPSFVSTDVSAPNAPDGYPVHPGFPIDLNGWLEKAPVTIADINGDGSNEMLVITYGDDTPHPGKIYAYDKNGTTLPGFPINTNGHLRGRMALGDLDHNGKLEIVVGVDSLYPGIGSSVYIWRPDGTLYPGWPQTTDCFQPDTSCSVASITLADLDNDSNLEVIVGTDNRDLTSEDPGLYVPNLYVWRSDGQPFGGNWPVDDDHNCAIIGAVAVGDVDGNGSDDIVTGRDYFRLFAYDSLGNNLPGWPHWVFWPYDNNNFNDDRISFGRSAVTLADLNNDGKAESIVQGLRSYAHTSIFYNDDLLVYGSDGQRWQGWELPASGSGVLSQSTWRMLQAPAIGDLNGDYRPDIVVSQQDGWVRAYTAEKQLLWEFNYAQGQIVYATEPVIGDVNGDGWNEVLFGTFDIDFNLPGPFGVWILDHNGNPLTDAAPLVVNNGHGVAAAPTLADLDGDGNIEITAATWYGKIYVWDTPGLALPGHLPWPMARHDLQRTGYYIDPSPNFIQSYKIPNNFTPQPGETVTFTVNLIQSGTPWNEPIQLIDTLPASLSYIPGSLVASSGTVDDSQAPTLRWYGSMFEVSQVVISYVTVVDILPSIVITSTAIVDAGQAGNFDLTATLIVNGKRVYLPVLIR